MSRRAAICGSGGPRRITVFFRSSLTCDGPFVGASNVRTGENAPASSTAIQRSPESSGCSACVAASPSRRAMSGGNMTPALGGCEERRRALITRPTPSAASMSASQSLSSSACLVTRASLSSCATARVDSSRATIGSSLAATTLRMSRRSRFSIWRRAASARSSHSATRNLGSRSSAIFTTVASGISGLPSAASLTFSS